eukprot:COSAG05_NODE_1251_length_5381_cov_82.840591_3_plen_71_part_00
MIIYGFADDHHILKTRAQQFQLFSNAAADMATMEITTYDNFHIMFSVGIYSDAFPIPSKMSAHDISNMHD